MLMHHLHGDALRVAVLLALTLAAMRVLRGASSAARRLVLATSLAGAFALPLVSAVVPAFRVQTPDSVASLHAVMIPEALVSAISPAAVSTLGPPAPRSDVERSVDLTAVLSCLSPLQVAAAYAVLANGGFYVAPTLTRRTGEVPRERVMKQETASSVVVMLEDVVSSDKATGTRARVEGQRVAGKTGTAAWKLPDGSERSYASFVGFVPSTSPRFVILVGLEQPHGEQAGGMVAAPVFSRVATRALTR